MRSACLYVSSCVQLSTSRDLHHRIDSLRSHFWRTTLAGTTTTYSAWLFVFPCLLFPSRAIAAVDRSRRNHYHVFRLVLSVSRAV